MSIIQRFGKRQFAFGLEWKEGGDDLDDVLDAVRDTEGGLYCVMHAGKRRGDPSCVGLFRAASATKGEIYPFAAAVAKLGTDGIYVMPLGEDKLWYVSIRDSLVVAGTDRIDDKSTALNSIQTQVALAERNGEIRKVFSPIEIRQTGWQVFDPQEVAQRAKVSPLKRSKEASKGAAIAAILIIFAIAGAAGWWFFLRGPSEAEKAAQAAEDARQAYVANLTQQLTNLPSDHAWVNLAYDRVADLAPSFEAGYVKEEVNCQPGSCVVRYGVLSDSAFSPETLREVLGDGLTLDPTGQIGTLNVPVPTQTVIVDDALLRAWPVSPNQTRERLGMLPIYAPNLAISREPIEEDLSAAAGSLPPGYVPITRTVVAVRLREPNLLLESDLAAIADYWANGGFVPTSLRWTSGLQGEAPTWSAEFTRVSGVP